MSSAPSFVRNCCITCFRWRKIQVLIYIWESVSLLSTLYIPKPKPSFGNSCLRIKRTILIPSLLAIVKEPSLHQLPVKQSKILCFSWQGVKDCGVDWQTFLTKVISPGWMVPSLTTQTGTMASQTTGMETSTVCTCAVQMGSGMTLSVKGWSLSSARKQRDHSKES